jgi:RNA polymerase sigma-70 factor, ECF subfamily
MTTEALIRAISRGERSSFEQLYKNMQRPMLAYASGLLAGDRAAAEDAVDDAFLDIWKGAAGYTGSGSAEGWIRRIVRNKAIDWVRRQKHNRYGEWSDACEELADNAPNPETIAMGADAAAWLRRSLANLSVEQREALILCYFEDRSLAEIADIMECPENTVKTRLFHARAKLRGLSFEATPTVASFNASA